jgi:predicted transcriptional regulator
VDDERDRTERTRGDANGTPEDGQLSLESRKQIFEYVQANPGSHFSELKRELAMETGLLQYHLRELEEYNVLESKEHQGKRRLFVTRELDAEEQSILSTLRYETSRKILLYLLEHGPARNGDIAEAVNIDPSTVTWHMSNLLDEGVLETIKDGRTTRYQVANEELTVQLLVRYRESFVDRGVDRIIDFWG